MRSEHAIGIQGWSRRVRWLVTVVGVMAVLTAGWPLVSLAVSDDQPAAAGQPLPVGPDTNHSAQFTPGRGWLIRSAGTDPNQTWILRRGPVDLSVTYVTLASPSQAGGLWPALQNILRLGNPSARLGKPAPLISSQGRKGLTGTVTENGREGQAAVFPGPTQDFAIEIVSVAPVKNSPAAREDAAQVVRSLRIPEASK
ncbi:MAG TPA: hypothetical protein VFE59_05455 [Trebonia sp.]|nr:hypothetical protein [Trebonia sp.]